MSSDFLGEASPAGQLLLRLVSRGNAILAELLRLSENIPQLFQTVPAEYESVIFDFRYLQNQDLYETRIEDSSELIDRDQALRETHGELIKRFYVLFEGILKYHRDLRHYVSDLEDGVFIQLSVESVLDNEDGKQLMCEAVYLWVVMLLLLDSLVPGPVRERIVVAHLRHRGHNELPLIDDVCRLTRSTGLGGSKRPPNYPEEYLARFELQQSAVSLVLGRLRSDDVYNAIRAYPQPEHRSTALAPQAAMLYTILYLAPDTLKREQAAMREITDKFFPDNWVISFYLGFTADLSVAWEPYKAARAAIANTIASSNVTVVAERHWGWMRRLETELAGYLTEGVLVEDFILDNIGKLLNCARSCNVALRWLLLHTSARSSLNRKLREAVINNSGCNGGGGYLDAILMLLLNTAQFEFVLKRVVQSILDSKQTRWDECKKEASTRMDELGEYFSGEKVLTRGVTANKHLEQWFHQIAREIDSLDSSASAVASGRKMQQLKLALEEVEQFHQLEQSLQVRQFLADVRKYLEQMLRICNVGPNVLAVLDLVSDLSYAWEVLREPETYVALLQQRIKADPALVLKLRSTLVKLSSILNVPLVRINQANSPDLMSVSAYYSDELVAYVRLVLEVIPRTVFELLNVIIDLQTHRIPELPTRVEKDRVREFAQLDERFKLAQATYSISVFTEGILAMETTLVGVDRVIPKRLLEDGIRKQLVHVLSAALDRILSFRSDSIEEMTQRLSILATTLDGHARSFQYIQDYIRMQGLRVWQEEFLRIVGFNVEQECAAFLTRRTELTSRFQSREVPIPVFPRQDSLSVNFSGRLARALLVHTDYRTTTFVPDASAWFGSGAKLLVGPETFTALLQGISVFGMAGLDQLYSFMIVQQFQTLLRRLRAGIDGDKATKKYLTDLAAELAPMSTIPREAAKLYESAVKMTKQFQGPLLDCACRVGQIQLLRRQFANVLDLTCKTDAGVLRGTLETLNHSLLKDIHAHYKDPENLPYPDPASPLLPELSKILDTAGLSDAMSKIYVTTDAVEAVPILAFLLMLEMSTKYRTDSQLGVLVPKKRDSKKHSRDSTPLVVGIVTLLRQFHSSFTEQFIALCGQYVRSQLNMLGFQQQQQHDQKAADIPPNVVCILFFLDMFLQHSGLPQSTLEAYLPPFVFGVLRQL